MKLTATCAIALVWASTSALAQDWSKQLDLDAQGPVHVVPFVEYLGPDAPGLRNSQRCGFRIGEGVGATWVVTVGAGPTELLSCDALIDFGAVGANDEFIGAIYRFRPTPQSSYLGPIMLKLDADSGQWVVDAEGFERLSNAATPIETLTALDEALNQ